MAPRYHSTKRGTFSKTLLIETSLHSIVRVKISRKNGIFSQCNCDSVRRKTPCWKLSTNIYRITDTLIYSFRCWRDHDVFKSIHMDMSGQYLLFRWQMCRLLHLLYTAIAKTQLLYIYKEWIYHFVNVFLLFRTIPNWVPVFEIFTCPSIIMHPGVNHNIWAQDEVEKKLCADLNTCIWAQRCKKEKKKNVDSDQISAKTRKTGIPSILILLAFTEILTFSWHGLHPRWIYTWIPLCAKNLTLTSHMWITMVTFLSPLFTIRALSRCTWT